MWVRGSATAQGLGETGPENGGEWYAIHARSNFEKRIAAELGSKGIEHYLPAHEEIHQWKDRKQKVALPLFPGYVFARFVDDPSLRLAVLKTAGVVRILGLGTAIEPIPDEQIEAVRRVLNSRVSFLVHPLLREGLRVRVTKGALAGLEGLLMRIKKQARLVVSIPLLSQSVAAEVNTCDVEPVCGSKTSMVRV